MNIDSYAFNANKDKLIFQFESVSENKVVLKQVIYTLIDEKELTIYNLFLGDFDPKSEILSDISITDNNDMEKVLATVIQTLFEFFSERPECYVFFTGSNSVRTRLYRIAISNYKPEYDHLFRVFGRIDNNFEFFKPNRNYDAFLISLK